MPFFVIITENGNIPPHAPFPKRLILCTPTETAESSSSGNFFSVLTLFYGECKISDMSVKKNNKKKINARQRLFEIISIGKRTDTASTVFDAALITIVFLNILSLILESFEQLAFLDGVFKALDIFSIIFFLIEYILRIITADYLYPKLSKGKAVFKFITSFDGGVALLTILPLYYLSGFVVFRLFRVARILRLFKINSSYDSFHVILSVFYE